MTAEELDAMKAGKIEHKNMQVRQVHNGFVGVYSLHFLEPSTETEVFSIGGEFVAADAASLLTAISQFFNTGGI